MNDLLGKVITLHKALFSLYLFPISALQTLFEKVNGMLVGNLYSDVGV